MNKTLTLIVLQLVCTFNRAQLLVVPFIANSSSMLEDIGFNQSYFIGTTSVFYYFVVAVVPFPLGLLVDCFDDTKLLISIFLGLTNILWVAAAISPDSILFCFCHGSILICSSILLPAAVKFISAEWPTRRQGVACSWLAAQTPLGLLTASMMIYTCSSIPWRINFVVHGLAGLLGTLLFYFAGTSQKIKVSLASVANKLTSSLRSQTLWLMAFGLFLRWGCCGGIEIYGPELFTTTFPDKTFFLSSTLFFTLVGCIFSLMSLGFVTDLFANSIKELRPASIAISTGFSALILMIFSSTQMYSSSKAFMAGFYLIMEAYFGVFLATVIDNSFYEIRGTVTGFLLTCGYIGNIVQIFTFNAIAMHFGAVYKTTIAMNVFTFIGATVCFAALTLKGNIIWKYSRLEV